MNQEDGLIIVDFDGTFVSVNSFKSWVYFLLRKSFFYDRGVFLNVLLLTFKRKVVRSLTHIQYKREINKIQYPKALLESFRKLLLRKINGVVLYELVKLKDSNPNAFFVLSTAAPKCYLEYFAQNLECFRFDKVFCSGEVGEVFFDNYRENKLKLIKGIFPVSSYTLFTDHHDDIFLAENASFVYLCNASMETNKLFCEKLVAFSEVVDESSKP